MLRATLVSLGKRVLKESNQTWKEAISPHRHEPVWVAHGKGGVDMEWPELPKSVTSLFDEGKMTFTTERYTHEFEEFQTAFLAALKDANHTVGKWLIMLPPGSGNRLRFLQDMVDTDPAVLCMEVAQTHVNGLLVGLYTSDFTNTDEVLKVAHQAHSLLRLPRDTFSRYKPIGVTQLERAQPKTAAGKTKRTKMFTSQTKTCRSGKMNTRDVAWVVEQAVKYVKAARSVVVSCILSQKTPQTSQERDCTQTAEERGVRV